MSNQTNRVVKVIFGKDVTEACFKLLGYVFTCASVMKIISIVGTTNLIVTISMVFIFFLLVIQTIIYSVVQIFCPIGSALWPSVNYPEIIDNLLKLDKTAYKRAISHILFTWPNAFILGALFVSFFGINELLTLLITNIKCILSGSN